MSSIKSYLMGNSTILRINAEREFIDTSPIYQRNGDLWNLEKRQLLIDSILNDYDIPKIYFHVLNERTKHINKSGKDYAIIDGRQRLETIWDFIDGKFPISTDFKYFKDKTINPANLTYPELAKKFPRLKILFDSFVLPVVLVETNDLELIEDMFSRLNEAVPLNAAEKRNAIGGPMAKVIRDVSNHNFFLKKVKISNKRYQHREISARLLFIEFSLKHSKKIFDTKKIYLDIFVHSYKEKKFSDSQDIKERVFTILDKMINIFSDKDSLLSAQASIPIYFLLFKDAIKQNKLSYLSRQKLIKFNKDRETNRKIAEKDITKADYELLEFDRLSQQGTNDASSIRERLRILKEYLQLS